MVADTVARTRVESPTEIAGWVWSQPLVGGPIFYIFVGSATSCRSRLVRDHQQETLNRQLAFHVVKMPCPFALDERIQPDRGSGAQQCLVEDVRSGPEPLSESSVPMDPGKARRFLNC